MKNKEYCCKAALNPAYILYIGCVFGAYSVFVTDEHRRHNYRVYGPYRHIGTAANRLLRSANSYHSNPVALHYMTKEQLHENGAFSEV
jgi:hypothetical protein